jgi:hypothetical protein
MKAEILVCVFILYNYHCVFQLNYHVCIDATLDSDNSYLAATHIKACGTH